MSKAQQEMQKKEDLKDAQKQLEAKFALGLPVDLPDYALNPDLAAFFKQAVVNKFAGVKPAQQVVEEEDVEQLRHADENLDLDFGGGFDDIGVREPNLVEMPATKVLATADWRFRRARAAKNVSGKVI